MKYITTKWQLATFDVWGNAKDGYEVNDTYAGSRVSIRCTVEKYNIGTPQEFESASPSDRQIRKVFGIPKTRIETGGDDMYITVNRERDGYPLGEMRCVSHSSLSPIKEIK